MPIRGLNFLICVAIAAVGIGCAKAEFDPIDGGPPPEKDGPVCSPSSDTCTPGPGGSDPCLACGQKCSYVVATAEAVQAVCVVPKGEMKPFEACEIFSEGIKNQTDTCGAGSVCLRPSGESGKFCFPLCSGSSDCHGVMCGPRKLASNASAAVSVCDPAYVQFGEADFCDPLAGTCGDGRYCFLVDKDASGHSRTVCEYSEGNGRDDPPAPCTLARDCFPQFTCVDNLCKRVCNADTPCDSGQKCVERGLEYGYCP